MALSNDEKRKVLEGGLDFAKTSTGVAAGALVLSIGWLGNFPSFDNVTRGWLFASWVVLGLAVGVGIFAQSAIPILLHEEIYDLDFWAFKVPFNVHQGLLVVGFVFLIVVIFRVAFSEPPTASLTNGTTALRDAVRMIPRNYAISKVAVLEPIRGVDSARPSLVTWHIQFELTSKWRLDHETRAHGQAEHRTVDVFVDSDSGHAFMALH